MVEPKKNPPTVKFNLIFPEKSNLQPESSTVNNLDSRKPQKLRQTNKITQIPLQMKEMLRRDN